MCFGGGAPAPPQPPPLPPAPPPPLPPKKPLPEPTPVETEINPQVKENKQKKIRNEMSKGTAELRIPLEPPVTTQGGPAGGLNT